MFTKKTDIAVAISAAFMLLFCAASCNNNAGDGTDGNGSNQVTAKANAGTTMYTRYNCASPEGQANLAAMEKALAIMRSEPCNKAYSWYYQGSIHGAADSIAGPNKLCDSYSGTPGDLQNELKEAWDNCTHYTGADLHFLLWHRLYIWYFEKIVRKLSGKKDFALPYWDYTNTAYRSMPPIFWQDTGNSLYTAARLPSLNTGMPINSSINNGFPDALSMIQNYQCKSYRSFNSGLETSPHNAMHVYIGGADTNCLIYNEIHQYAYPAGGLMYDPGTAGYDPIFFVHHANIDYLFEVWNQSANGAMPDSAQLAAETQPYVFFDENGNKAVWTLSEMLQQAYNMDYTYDTLPPTLKSAQKPKKAVPENKQEVLSIDTKTPVNTKTKLLNLSIPAAATNKVQSMMMLDLSRRSTILSVTVAFTKEPRSIYNVYIDTDKEDKTKLAGVIAFFGATMKMKGMEMHGSGGEYTKTFIFDVTDEINIKTMKKNLKVLVVKKGSLSGNENEITVKHVKLETIDN